MAGLVPAIGRLLVPMLRSGCFGTARARRRRSPCRLPFPPSPRFMFRTCRQLPGFGLQLPQPVSAMLDAPMFCSRCSNTGTTAAGVFTRSKCPSAPVEWCRAHLKTGKARALVVNSGNANAFTGKSGRDACKFTAQIASRAAGCKPNDVFLASTGVIGEPLKAQAFEGVMEGLVARARAGRFSRCRTRDHDHRHIPESGNGERQRSARQVSRSTGLPKAPA